MTCNLIITPYNICYLIIFSIFQFFSTFQSADGYLVELATRYSTELRTNYGDVLQQLEDLRLAEWSDHAPPPPLAPGHNGQQSCSSTASTASIMTSMASNNPSSSDHLRTMGGQPPRQSYVNYPRGQDNEPIYVPGSYLVSQVKGIVLGGATSHLIVNLKAQ